jgi:DNA-binding HxlR family transcriptional regulator
MLAAPLNWLILKALEKEPRRQSELRLEAGSPAQTTLRAQLKKLTETGAVAKHRRSHFPGVLEYELTGPGQELLFVASVLEGWLWGAPGGPKPPGSNAAKAAIKALVEGWSTTMLRALAAGPLSLTELDSLIDSLSYPALERRLGAMRLTGQIEAHPSNGRGTPYAVTEWLRQGVAPLVVAAQWERRHRPQGTPPIGRLDTEAAFLLAVPLLRLPAQLSGSCRMAADIPMGKKRRLAGVMVEVENGVVVSCNTQLQGHPDAWALASTAGWLSAVVEHDGTCLELGGDSRLARALVDGLHEALFRPTLDVGNSIRDDRVN